jgi:uncharacterized OB-fold protein
MTEEFRFIEHCAGDINRTIPKRYRLQGCKCSKCGALFVTKRLICPECKGTDFEALELSGRGKVYTYSTIRVPLLPILKKEAYAVGIIELDEGVKAEGQIVNIDPDDVKIGMEVDTTIRRAREEYPGKVIYMYRFKPVRQ